MGESTAISWTDATFNPWRGCQKVSAGCRNCYAEELSLRMPVTFGTWGNPGTRVIASESYWNAPLRWNARSLKAGRATKVFCASLCDIFEEHPVAETCRPRLWDLIRRTPFLTWQILTKRPERISGTLPDWWGSGPINVWLGTSVEDSRVRSRASTLSRVPAAIRFLSYEPAIGPLEVDLSGIHWVICGGESGPRARPFRIEWAKDLRRQCSQAGVAFFFKQMGGRHPGTGADALGEIVQEFPQRP